jgi:hypothetical protein
MNPKARQNNLLVHEVENEVVVYDTEGTRAHCLNPSAAKVWRLLDGNRSVSAIASELGVDQSVVELAVDDLANARLLDEAEPLPVSRRTALRRVAVAAAVGFLLPAVTSIAAPLAAHAQSGGTDLKTKGTKTKDTKSKDTKSKDPK